jgi:hypothetical protein
MERNTTGANEVHLELSTEVYAVIHAGEVSLDIVNIEIGLLYPPPYDIFREITNLTFLSALPNVCCGHFCKVHLAANEFCTDQVTSLEWAFSWFISGTGGLFLIMLVLSEDSGALQCRSTSFLSGGKPFEALLRISCIC